MLGFSDHPLSRLQSGLSRRRWQLTGDSAL
jgi:hypothetical protein